MKKQVERNILKDSGEKNTYGELWAALRVAQNIKWRHHRLNSYKVHTEGLEPVDLTEFIGRNFHVPETSINMLILAHNVVNR